MIEIIPAPGRQLKTASMILGIALVTFDLSAGLLMVFEQIRWIPSHEIVVGVNAIVSALMVVVRFIKQSIEVTTEQKTALVAAAAASPMKAGFSNVEVKVDDLIVPSTPSQPERKGL